MKAPIRIMASVLGLPWQDDDWIDSSQALIRAMVDESLQGLQLITADDSGPPSDTEEIERKAKALAASKAKSLAASDALAERLTPYAERAMAGKNLGDDLISMYAQDGPDIFPDWGMDDMVAGILTAFFAGSDTTAFAITNGTYLLLTTPGLRDELRAGGETVVSAFVDEALRLIGVPHFLGLNVVKDTEIGGVKIKKGSMVAPVLGSANVDPSHYECPFEVKLDRKNPRDHTTFWMGPRACAGHVARPGRAVGGLHGHRRAPHRSTA